MKYSVVLVVAAVILPGLEALRVNSQSEEAVVDRWLDEPTVERQSLEEACRKRQEMAAVKMKRAQEMREKVRAKLLTLENELKELTDSASKVCKADVAATAALNSAKVENCDLNCKEVCVPGVLGYKCGHKVWGKCVSRVPAWNSCARKVIDPKCRFLEEKCNKEKAASPERILNDSKAKLQEAKEDMNVVTANDPQEFKKGQE